MCECCVRLGWAPEGFRPCRWGQHADSRSGSVGFFPRRSCGLQVCSSITDVFHADTNFQRSLVVKKPSKEEADAATPPANVRLKF